MSEASTVGNNAVRQSNAFAVYCAGATAWIAVAYAASLLVPKMPLWFFIVATVVTALPIAFAGAYTSTIAQLRTIVILKPTGGLHKLLSGRVLRSVLWTLWALVSAVIMILNFSTSTRLEWVALVVSIPLFWVALRILIPFNARQLRHEYLVMGFSVHMARWVGAAVTIVLYGLLIWYVGAIESHASLAEAIAAKRSALPEQAGNSIVQVALQLITLKDGAGGHYAAMLDSRIAMALTILNSAVVFLGWAASLACFAIRPAEYRRVFGPLSDSEVLPPVSNRRIVVATAIFAFVALFIFVPTINEVNELVERHQLSARIKQAERKLERIDGEYFESGTIEKLQAARAKALASIDAALDVLEAQVDRGFDRLEHSVDAYLDWYYSLSAEYMRIAKLVTGDIEKYMAEELQKRMKQAEALAVIEGAIKKALAEHEMALGTLEREKRAILDANRVSQGKTAGVVVRDATLEGLFVLPSHVETIDLSRRLKGAAIAAAVGGVVGADIAGKVMRKSAFKNAAKAIGKTAASKAATRLALASMGAVAGSYIPVLGNVIGAAIGAAIGGVLADTGLLKLEEAINRDAFKQEILAAIRETRAEFKKKLLATH